MDKTLITNNFADLAESSSLEEKMMYRFLFVLAIICGYYSAYDLWIGNIIFFSLNFTVSICCFIFYYLMKYRNLYQYVVVPAIIFIFCMITLSFFALNGFYSASITSFTVLGFTITLIFSKHIRLFLFTFFCIGMCVLLYIQVQHPDLIYYVALEEIKTNVLMNFADNTFLLIVMAMIIRDEYMREKNTILTQQKVLERQNEQIKEQNKEILSYNEGISYINQHLERLAKERTEKLEEQNQQLIHYAFYNAHKVRAPLARILGLVSLMKIEQSNSEEVTKFYLKSIIENIEELDSMIKVMNKEITQ